MDFSFVRHFKEDKSNTGILVWRVEKTKKVDFAIGFCCLDAVFLRGKEDNEEKAKELRDRLLLRYFSAFLLL